jgi:hypothetical protein
LKPINWQINRCKIEIEIKIIDIVIDIWIFGFYDHALDDDLDIQLSMAWMV